MSFLGDFQLLHQVVRRKTEVGFSLTPLAQIEYYPGCDKAFKRRHIFAPFRSVACMFEA